MLTMSAVKKVGLLGRIGTARMYALTNDLVLGFFDRYLDGRGELLERLQKANHPEVALLSKVPGERSRY